MGWNKLSIPQLQRLYRLFDTLSDIWLLIHEFEVELEKSLFDRMQFCTMYTSSQQDYQVVGRPLLRCMCIASIRATKEVREYTNTVSLSIPCLCLFALFAVPMRFVKPKYLESIRPMDNETECTCDSRYKISIFPNKLVVSTGLHVELNMHHTIIVSGSCTMKQGQVTWLANFNKRLKKIENWTNKWQGTQEQKRNGKIDNW